MADYISKYTGAQIDLSIASGSTPSGLITASKLALGGASGSVDGITVKGDISASGNFYLQGNIEATQITSSKITSSVIITEGSNIFGDATTDQHTFNGSISASSNLRVTGNISSSGTIYIGDKVGVGTLSPAVSTHIYKAATTSTAPLEMLRLEVNDEGVDMNIGHGPSIDYYVGETGGSNYGGAVGVIREVAGDADSAAAMVFHTATDDQGPGQDREKVRITSTGKVGIGTTAPTKELTVQGDISASGDFYFGGGQSQYINFGDISDDNAGQIHYNHVDNEMDIRTGGVKRLNISSSGGTQGEHTVVGIGNAQPTKTLTVGGDISASGELYVDGDLFVSKSVIGPSGTTTSSISAALTVVGDISSSGDVYVGDDLFVKGDKLQFLSATNYLTDASGHNRITITDGGTMTFSDEAGNATMYLRADQNIGIRNAYATKELTVGGSISASGTFDLQESASIGVTTTGAGGAGTKIPNKGLFVSGSISGSATSTGSFGYAKITGNISASGTFIGGGLNIDGTTTFNDGNITNVGEINVDTVQDDATGGDTKIEINGTTMTWDVGGETHLESTATTAKFSVPLTVAGDISASGTFDLQESASIGVTTTGVGAGTTIPNKGLYVSGSISGSSTSTGSFGYIKTDGDVIADGSISGSEITIAAAAPSINITETDQSNHTWAIILANKNLWFRNQSDTNLPFVIGFDSPTYTLTLSGSKTIKQPQVGIGNVRPPEALTVSGSISSSGATYLDKSTFANDDATPTVLDGTYWETGTNTDTITTFDDGKIGQIIYVISKAAITYDVTSTTLKCGTTDLVTADGDLTTWLNDGTNWVCLGFTDQSDDLS